MASGSLSLLMAFASDLKPDLRASRDQLETLSKLILDAHAACGTIEFSSESDFADFPNLSLFPMLHKWLDAKMVDAIDVKHVDNLMTMRKLLTCMGLSLMLLMQCFGENHLRKSLAFMADQAIEDKKLWVILASIPRALTATMATMSKVTEQITTHHGILFLAIFDAYKMLGILFRVITHFGILGQKDAYKAMSPLLTSSCCSSLIASCVSLGDHLDALKILKDIKSFNVSDQEKHLGQFNEALIWYGDLLSYVKSKSERAERQQLYNVMLSALEGLVIFSLHTGKISHPSFYRNWLDELISSSDDLSSEARVSAQEKLYAIAMNIQSINFRQISGEEQHLFDLWAMAAGLLLEKINQESIEHRITLLSHIESHLRHLARSSSAVAGKIEAFVSLSRLATVLAGPLMSGQLDEDSARSLLSLLVTERKASSHLTFQLPDASESFEHSCRITKSIARSLFAFSMTVEMNRWGIRALDEGPLIHFFPALKTSSIKTWETAEMELTRITKRHRLEDTDEEKEILDNLSSNAIKRLSESISISFDSVASACNRILEYTNRKLSKAERRRSPSHHRAAYNDVSSTSSTSNRERSNEEGQRRTEEAEEDSFDPHVTLFPIAMIYASGALTEMLFVASKPVRTLLESGWLDDADKIQEVIMSVSRALGLILDLASLLTRKSLVAVSSDKSNGFYLLHISLAADIVQAVMDRELIEALSQSSTVSTREGKQILIHLLAKMMECLSSSTENLGSLVSQQYTVPASHFTSLLASSAEASRRMAVCLVGLKMATAGISSQDTSSQSFGLDSVTQALLLGNNVFDLVTSLLDLTVRDRDKIDLWKMNYYKDWACCLDTFMADEEQPLMRFCSSLNCANFRDNSELYLEQTLAPLQFNDFPDTMMYCEQCRSLMLTHDQTEGPAIEDVWHPSESGSAAGADYSYGADSGGSIASTDSQADFFESDDEPPL